MLKLNIFRQPNQSHEVKYYDNRQVTINIGSIGNYNNEVKLTPSSTTNDGQPKLFGRDVLIGVIGSVIGGVLLAVLPYLPFVKWLLILLCTWLK